MLIQGLEGPQSPTVDATVVARAAEVPEYRPSQPSTSATTAQVTAAVDRANKSMQSIESTVQFEMDPDSKVMVIKIVDSSDQKVLRQMPTEEMLRIASSLDQMQGLLLSDNA
jgi:flagellar protein FlaG